MAEGVGRAAQGAARMTPALERLHAGVNQIRQQYNAATIFNVQLAGPVTLQTGTYAYTLDPAGYVTFTPQTWTTTTMYTAATNAGTLHARAEFAEYRDEYVRPLLQPRERTEEEIAAQAERDRVWREQQAERRRHLDAAAAERAERLRVANERARDLMRAVLTDAQWEQFDTGQPITVRGSAGGLYQVVCNGTNGNVRHIAEDGTTLATLCAHPYGYDGDRRELPVTDLHAGQVLALQADEQGWLSRANVHYGARPAHYVAPADDDDTDW
jgi:hypothetical protein